MWIPIEQLPMGKEVLLIANKSPHGRYKSDVYHGWRRGDWFTRWPHLFPPTHYMEIPEYPTDMPKDKFPKGTRVRFLNGAYAHKSGVVAYMREPKAPDVPPVVVVHVLYGTTTALETDLALANPIVE